MLPTIQTPQMQQSDRNLPPAYRSELYHRVARVTHRRAGECGMHILFNKKTSNLFCTTTPSGPGSLFYIRRLHVICHLSGCWPQSRIIH